MSGEAGTLTARPPRDEVFATGRATAAYLVPETGTKFRGSVGTGAKSPSLYQRFGAFTQADFLTNGFVSVPLGSPDLSSERSFGFDYGVDQSFFDNRLALSATAFRTDYRDLIDFAIPDYAVFPVIAPTVCSPIQTAGCHFNVSRARTSGLELEANVDVAPGLVRLKAAVTLLDAFGFREREVDGERVRESYRLPHRPTGEARIALPVTPLPGLLIEPRMVVVGARFNGVNETGRLPPFARFDLYAEYKIDDTFGVFARAENLTDIRYEEVLDYGTAGRSIFAGLRATW